VYDWWVYSSPDLVTWTLRDELYPNATPAPPSDYDNCWATDGAHKRNAATGAWEYFFYMSIGTCQVAVMKSTATPAGPWDNVLGTPLLNASLGDSLNPKACFRDPAVFEDDDGSFYIFAGVFDYYVAKLGDDLVSLAEAPRLVSVLDPTGPYGAKTDDKPFVHKANGLYYLSWGCFYGTATSVYGPYTYRGSAIATAALAPDFRMNDTAGPWYGHQDYADRHGSFWVNDGGQSFYASNDRSHSTGRVRSVFRDTVVGYVHYFANASIAPVAIDGAGVGAYDASARVEAENFMSARGAARKVHEAARGDAFAVAVSGAGAALSYPHVRGARGALSLVAANAGAAAVAVAARRGGARGAPLAACRVPPTGGAYRAVACETAPLDAADAADVDLVLTFEAEGGAAVDVRVDSFAFGA